MPGKRISQNIIQSVYLIIAREIADIFSVTQLSGSYQNALQVYCQLAVTYKMKDICSTKEWGGLMTYIDKVVI